MRPRFLGWGAEWMHPEEESGLAEDRDSLGPVHSRRLWTFRVQRQKVVRDASLELRERQAEGWSHQQHLWGPQN